MAELQIPKNIEAEIALIGCVFVDENVMAQVSDELLPEDFYDSKNKLIFKTMLQLYKEKKNIDVATVVSVLQNKQLLEQCGGYDYISSIAEYSTYNIDSYIALIAEAAIKRSTIDRLSKLSQEGYDIKLNAFEYVDRVEKEVFELSKRRRVDAFKTIAEVSKNVLANTSNNANRKNDVLGLDTGYNSLNKYTQGFQNGSLIILAARPSMGKSAFAMNLAVNVAQRNKGGEAKVAIFSLEMAAEQLVERMIACDSNIRLNQIRNGTIKGRDEWIHFNSSCAKLGSLNLFFDDSSDSTISSIRAKCRKLASEQGLDFVVIDYLQLIESENTGSRATQQEKISKISRSLKLMARELEVPVLALSQLSRAVEQRDKKRPMMADLRDSGSIEQDADIVMFIYRDEYYNQETGKKNGAEIIISKNRSGSTHDGLPFIFQGEFAQFREEKE